MDKNTYNDLHQKSIVLANIIKKDFINLPYKSSKLKKKLIELYDIVVEMCKAEDGDKAMWKVADILRFLFREMNANRYVSVRSVLKECLYYLGDEKTVMNVKNSLPKIYSTEVIKKRLAQHWSMIEIIKDDDKITILKAPTPKGYEGGNMITGIGFAIEHFLEYMGFGRTKLTENKFSSKTTAVIWKREKEFINIQNSDNCIDFNIINPETFGYVIVKKRKVSGKYMAWQRRIHNLV